MKDQLRYMTVPTHTILGGVPACGLYPRNGRLFAVHDGKGSPTCERCKALRAVSP